MSIRKGISAVLLLALVISLPTGKSVSQNADTPYFGRYDKLKLDQFPKSHAGAGSIILTELVGSRHMKTPLLWIHRGVIPPHCGIGAHYQAGMEDMFFAFNQPAEFTINGHTSLLPAGSMVPCPLESWHGIYNNSDTPLEWMNIGVSIVKDKYKVIDLADSLTDRRCETPPEFLWNNFDRSLMKPVTKVHQGKGELLFRRVLNTKHFKTNIEFLDHLILPPDTSIGYHQHTKGEEIYYIMHGKGRMTVNDKTWDVCKGDAIPCPFNGSHGIYNNSGKELEIFVLAISMNKGEFDAVDKGDDLSKR